MFNKDKELLEGLVLVWGNDYQKTQNAESENKYIDNFTKLLNIYQQQYYDEIRTLQNPSSDLLQEEKRLTSLIELEEAYLDKETEMTNSYKKIIGSDFQIEPTIDQTNLNNLKNKQKIIKQYLDNNQKLKELRKSNDSYNQQLLDINEKLIQDESENINLEEELSKYFDQNFAIPFDDEESYQLRTKIINIYDERIDIIEELINKTDDQELKQNKDNELSKIKFENFNLKNQLMLYDIKKLLETRLTTYPELKNKRDQISKLIAQRDHLIKAYAFQVYSDDYNEFVEKINKQIETLEPQKEAINQKEKIESELKNNIAKIEKIESDNNKGEILEIRKNFCPVTELSLEDNSKEEKQALNFEKKFDLDEFIKNNKKEEIKEETSLPPSLEEDLLKEEQNLEQILEELDIKLDQISSTPKPEKKVPPKIEKEEIPNIEDVINELKKQYPTDLPKEFEEVKEEPQKEKIKVEESPTINKIESGKNDLNRDMETETKEIEPPKEKKIEMPHPKNENNFHGALDSITNIIDEKQENADSFVFTPEDDNSLLSVLSNNDSSQLDFLNGEALDNILNSNIYKNNEEG